MDSITFEKLSAARRKEIMDIYNYYAENSMSAYPEQRLPYGAFDRFLEMTKGYPAYSILSEGVIAGFCFIRAYNSFPAFRETAEITYFLHKDFSGKGIGSIALARLEKDAAAMGVKNLLASITSGNIPSLKFHEKNGFTEAGRFSGIGKKFGKNFDIIWMQKKINEVLE